MIDFNLVSIVGTVALISGAVLPWLIFRQSKAVNKNTTEISNVAQVIAALQEDNKIYRAENKELNARVDELEKKLNRMYRKYGNNNDKL